MDLNANPASGKLRVFLVEDSAEMRARIIESAIDRGYANIVGCAESEGEAVAGISILKPDAVVLDIQLREGNGLNVLRWLKKQPVESRPKVVVFTNYANPEFRRYAEGQGAGYFLDKALEFRHLEGLLRLFGEEPSI